MQGNEADQCGLAVTPKHESSPAETSAWDKGLGSVSKRRTKRQLEQVRGVLQVPGHMRTVPQ